MAKHKMSGGLPPDGKDAHERPTWQGEPEPPPSEPEPTNDSPTKPSLVEETIPQRGVGWQKDSKDERDYPARPMLGAPTNLPAEWFGLIAFIGHIQDQLWTSSCVGQAIGTAIMIRLRALGVALAEVSRLAIYAWARMRAKLDVEDTLADVGSYPRLAMKALAQDGVPEESFWPFDAEKVNEELPWDVQQNASAARLSRYYRVDSDDHGRVHDIMNALAQNYPVVFGTFVDRTFMALAKSDGDVFTAPVVKHIDASDPHGGGHMMCLVGYRTTPEGIEFLTVNSWGVSWGWRGLAWIHQDVLVSPMTDDLYVLQVGT